MRWSVLCGLLLAVAWAGNAGLQRKTGHIGFLGHNEPIEFRNIRIKEL